MAETGESYAEARRHVLNLDNQGTSDFIALCGSCGGTVEPETGMVWISSDEHQAAREAYEQWTLDRFDRSRELEALGDAATIHDQVRLESFGSPGAPWPAQWQVHHYACWYKLDSLDTRWVANGVGIPYKIGTERIRTYADLVWWSAHFERKEFVRETDWSLLLNEAHGEVFDRDWNAHPRRFRPVRGPYAQDRVMNK
ncbi:hypothetical protein OG780_11450 [Streptomyces sp. NBC_00386]|uniref:hypothetical protein n=1 Tax=Streptomyces sp. NBC_00386 TaxID=2975734 RepID=UPI002E2154DE